MLSNFSFLIPGQLAGCAQPGRSSDLANDLAELSAKGIGAIVSLTESPLDPRVIHDTGFRALHLPIRDFTSPTRGQVEKFVDFVDSTLATGVAVAVHCGAGIGRTGTMLACYLVHRGQNDEDAVDAVRAARPGSIETTEQERCVADYYKTITIKKRKKK